MIMQKASVKTVLEEGKYYPFRVTGSVILPDGSDCFILTDVNGVKHLLYKEFYSNYKLTLNKEILCRIDKINCTGKIFIEPEHPYYKLGSSYTFVFDHYVHLEGSDGDTERLAVLKNGYAEDIFLAADEVETPLKEGEQLTAVVEKIKKGRVYITPGTSVNDYTGMEAGKKYRFTLKGTMNVGGRYAYYILRGDNGREFRIRKKFYAKYGLKKGDAVTCELIETDHQVFLEPVHPFYEVGFNYEFRISGETTMYEYPDQEAEAYLLEVKYGKDAVIRKADVSPDKINGDMIKCTIIAIKKSQVFLACQ